MKAALLAILLATACTSSSSTSPAPAGTSTSAAQHKAPSGPPIEVVVALSGSRPMADVVRDLEQRGFVVEQRLEKVDIVTGRVDPDAVPALRNVPGVQAVAQDHPAQLPPPGKPQ